MNFGDNSSIKISLLALLGIAVSLFIGSQVFAQNPATPEQPQSLATAIFAGGCFWCIESDFEKLDGVSEVVSGYTGGSAETATYKQVVKNNTGHYEAVEVSYDPDKIDYATLVEYFWHHIDPTDPLGQFCDKGDSYKSAIFYASAEQEQIVRASLAKLEQSKPFTQDIVTAIEAAKPFYRAEEYHQDYYKKNPFRYNYYRRGCGRDARVAEVWAKSAKQ